MSGGAVLSGHGGIQLLSIRQKYSTQWDEGKHCETFSMYHQNTEQRKLQKKSAEQSLKYYHCQNAGIDFIHFLRSKLENQKGSDWTQVFMIYYNQRQYRAKTTMHNGGSWRMEFADSGMEEWAAIIGMSFVPQLRDLLLMLLIHRLLSCHSHKEIRSSVRNK